MTLGRAPETSDFPRGARELRLRERHMARARPRGSQRGVWRLRERGPGFPRAPSPAKSRRGKGSNQRSPVYLQTRRDRRSHQPRARIPVSSPR
ncbi:unnamed protein product [Merluccius merluccius]